MSDCVVGSTEEAQYMHTCAWMSMYMHTYIHTHVVKHANYDTMKLVTYNILTCIFSMCAHVCPK